MATQEIYRIAEETVKGFYEEVTVSVWNEQRVYLNRPNESKKYQDVGYIRLSDMAVFPACGTPRTSRDKDAVDLLNKVAENLKNGEVKPEEPTEFKSLLPW